MSRADERLFATPLESSVALGDGDAFDGSVALGLLGELALGVAGGAAGFAVGAELAAVGAGDCAPGGSAAFGAEAAFRSAAKSPVPEVTGLDFPVLLEEARADEDRISSATCHRSMRPRTRGALIRLMLLAPVGGVRLVGLKTLYHLANGFGALR